MQELPFDSSIIENMYNGLLRYNDNDSVLRIIISGLSILLLLYIVSLPIQVVSYLIISIINYFRNHEEAYIKLFKIYLRCILDFVKKCGK